jgi:hypothetical protein
VPAGAGAVRTGGAAAWRQPEQQPEQQRPEQRKAGAGAEAEDGGNGRTASADQGGGAAGGLDNAGSPSAPGSPSHKFLRLGDSYSGPGGRGGSWAGGGSGGWAGGGSGGGGVYTSLGGGGGGGSGSGGGWAWGVSLVLGAAVAAVLFGLGSLAWRYQVGGLPWWPLPAFVWRPSRPRAAARQS